MRKDFDGITVKVNIGNEHNPPHFHVKYQDLKARFFMNGRQINGDKMPPPQLKRIKKWVQKHQKELWDAWALAKVPTR